LLSGSGVCVFPLLKLRKGKYGNGFVSERCNRDAAKQSAGGYEHYGEEHFESDEAKAMLIVERELKRRRWKEEDLKARRKGDKTKVAIAARLRKETTMTLKWIAEHLMMGSWNNVSNRLASARKPRQ